MISILKITKGNNSAKRYNFHTNNLEWYQSCRVDTISILKITKGNNSAKNVGGVTAYVVNLCTLSGHALYFHQVL